MTIDARSATDSGARRRAAPARPPAASSRWREGARVARARGRRGRRSAARPPRAAAAAKRSAGGELADRERVARRRRLHRVDQVVGDVDAVERLGQPGAGRHVAEDELVGARAVDPRRVAARTPARCGRAPASAGIRAPPIAPLAPVTRILTAPKASRPRPRRRGRNHGRCEIALHDLVTKTCAVREAALHASAALCFLGRVVGERVEERQG